MAVVFSESNFAHEFAKHFHANAIFVCRTDTVYGLHGVYGSPEAAAMLRDMKQRPDERFITLVANIDSAAKLAKISDAHRRLLGAYWPGPYTFVLPGLHEETISLRVPDYPLLQQILPLTGLLRSTSCNLHGEPVAKDIEAAIALFWDRVTFYIDGGEVTETKPSTLIDLTQDFPKVLRQGMGKFPRD